MPKPDPGNARHLTDAESRTTGLTRDCIVYNNAGDIVVLLKVSDGWKEMIKDHSWLICQLEHIWTVKKR